MKEGIHPSYRPVVFQDASVEFSVLTQSTVRTSQTIQWEDGNEYPLVRVDVSSASHPFYTGKQKLMDAAGRVEKFRRKFGNTKFAGQLLEGADASESASESAPESAPE